MNLLSMLNPCSYCIEEQCNGKHNCNCAACKNASKCNKILKPTIRITKKCTQYCDHCIYECSPNNTEQMTVDTATNISKFLLSNNIQIITIMGGEFFCNPDWASIIPILCSSVLYCRLVTNGDWIENFENEVLETLSPIKDILKISISKDRWHNNKNVNKAIEFCLNNNFKYNTTSSEEDSENAIIPVGRGQYTYNMFASFSCYCHNPDHMYSFLIDENGVIYKCSAGTWDYSTVNDHLDGTFSKRFKKANQKFHSIFISNCRSCRRSYLSKQ